MADVKISAMASASDLAGAEFAIIQGGVNKRVSASLLAAGNPAGGVVFTGINILTSDVTNFSYNPTTHVINVTGGYTVNGVPVASAGNWRESSGATLSGDNTIAAGANKLIFTSGVTTGTGPNAGMQQVYNSLTSGNGIDISSTSLSSGVLIKGSVVTTAVNHTLGTNAVGWFEISGANANASRTAIALAGKSTNTGATNTNIGVYGSASGASTNWAGYFAGNLNITGKTFFSQTSTLAPINLGTAGADPSSIIDSDIWMATGGMAWRNASATRYVVGSQFAIQNANAIVVGTGANSDVTTFSQLIYNTQNGLSVTTVGTSGTGRAIATFTGATHTGLTASTENVAFKVAGATQQWATGAITNQRFNYFSAFTISFVGSSTVTNAYGAYFEAPVAGTNATITNTWAAGFIGNISMQNNSNITAQGSFSVLAPLGTGLTLSAGNGSGIGNIIIQSNGILRTQYLAQGSQTHAMSVQTSGNTTFVTWTAPANTNQTASTEEIIWNFNGSATVQFANGALTTQRAFLIQAPVYSHVSGSNTITNAGTFVVTGAPTTTGGFTTITNPYSIWAQAGMTYLQGGVRLTATSTTGYVWKASDALGNGGWAAAGSGITNSAVNTELMMSDGTNAVSSGLYTPSSGNFTLGDTGLAGANRAIQSQGSALNVGITIQTKGTGQMSFAGGASTIISLSSSTLAFWNVSGVGQQSVNSILVNNVTSGGSVSTIADFTSLTIYSTDAATIRNNFFRLTEKVLKLETALRNYGLVIN